MKILITGSAGFIGFNLSNELIKNKKYQSQGIDNFNEYYDINLKLDRSKLLNQNGFITKKIDISKKDDLSEYFKDQNFDIVIHLAAQAGVRYSIENPDSYINSNIVGTFNLLEAIKKSNIKHLIVASTSSVYGFQDEIKFSEHIKADSQISLYSSTKKSAESIAHSYSYTYEIPTTVIRFFTVYGPWGRPDMALFKFVKAILEDKEIEIYNDGKMWRDFTYIDDLVHSIIKLIEVNPQDSTHYQNDTKSLVAPFRVVNIGNQKSIELNDFIASLEKIMDKKAKKVFLPMQLGDVPYTLSDCTLLNELIGFHPSTPVEIGIKNFFEWYKQYYQLD